MEYDYLIASTLQALKEGINAHLADGWTLYGDVQVLEIGTEQTLYQGFLKAKIDCQPQSFAERFARGYAGLDQRLRDLLEINGITLAYNDTGFTVEHDGKTTELSPFRVMSLLVASKHCPIDLDEQWVMDQITENFA